MRLLLTNDDGLSAVFLHELAFALRDAGHDVSVVAPLHEQSWIGKAVSRNRPVHVREEDRGLGCPTWSVDGTPSDCVNIALNHLLKFRPDAVVSGINIGFNAGIPFILGSGTIGGALEGSFHGIAGIAASQHMRPEVFERLRRDNGKPTPELSLTIKTSAACVARMLPQLVSESNKPDGAFNPIVHNLNFPIGCQLATPVRRTVPARVIMGPLFGPAENGAHTFVFSHGQDVSPDGQLTDRACLHSGWISHTILDCTRLGVPV